MNWLQRRAQAKPMALPFQRPPDDSLSWNSFDRYPGGLDFIDQMMTKPSADQLKQQYQPEYVGSGSAGVVMRLNNGHMGKLTDDYSEIQFAKWIADHPQRRVVRVFGVHYPQEQKTDPATSTRTEPLWMIEMQPVRTLTTKEKEVADGFSSWKYLAQGEGDSEWGRETYQNARKKWPDQLPLIDELMAFGREFSAAGMECGDARGDNIGWVDDHLVLIDLGGSSTSGR